MEPIAIILDNLFHPQFVAGVLIGGSFVYAAISRGVITAPPIVQLREELAGVRASLDAAKKELTDLRQEVESFIEWRQKLAAQALGKASTD